MQTPSKMRPTVGLAVEGYQTTFPADILLLFDVETEDDDGSMLPPQALAFCQFYEHVYPSKLDVDPDTGENTVSVVQHPLVPFSDYMYLHNTFTVVPVSGFLQPELLIPNLAPLSPRTPPPRPPNNRPPFFRLAPLF